MSTGFFGDIEPVRHEGPDTTNPLAYRFYDAGEFRDYAEHTFLEFLRDLDAPERV